MDTGKSTSQLYSDNNISHNFIFTQSPILEILHFWTNTVPAKRVGSISTTINVEIKLEFAFTTIIVVLFEQTPVKLNIPVTLITVIGLVVGLLLTYRTNTAYDRYWEGRRLWSTMVTTIRNFTRFIWVHVEDKNSTRIILEKRTAINLLVGFAVATKHYLREEDGCAYDDIRPLISNVHSKLPGFTPIVKAHDDNNNNKQSTLWDQLFHRTKNIQAFGKKKSSNSAFERVLRSPIPLAYSIHLAQTVWVYCLSLPFQLVGQANYATIPIVFFASMVLIGIERIVKERSETKREMRSIEEGDEKRKELKLKLINNISIFYLFRHIKDELDGIISSSIRYEPPSPYSLKETKNDDTSIDIEK
ncbi:8562_t:CDS:2 [Entrophospora sp. SA101]|nr:8562_t:CDS:2 [Entrophospora sp. SA101]